MGNNDNQEQDYLIAKKEAFSWFMWFGVVYLVIVLQAIVLLTSEISTFGRFLNIANVVMIPTVLGFSLPPFRKANTLAFHNPELKLLKSNTIRLSKSAKLLRLAIVTGLLLILTSLFFNYYNKGMTEKEKGRHYIINTNK